MCCEARCSVSGCPSLISQCVHQWRAKLARDRCPEVVASVNSSIWEGAFSLAEDLKAELEDVKDIIGTLRKIVAMRGMPPASAWPAHLGAASDHQCSSASDHQCSRARQVPLLSHATPYAGPPCRPAGVCCAMCIRAWGGSATPATAT